MSKRVTLNNQELRLLDTVLSEVLADGGDYALSGKIGKQTIQSLLRKLGLNTQEPPIAERHLDNSIPNHLPNGDYPDPTASRRIVR